MSVSEFKAGLAGLGVLVALIAGVALRERVVAAHGNVCACVSEDLRFPCNHDRHRMV